MTDSANWLDDALKSFTPIPQMNSKGILPGQIRLVEDLKSDFARLCVILEVHSESNYCEIMLIHHEEDMATNDDLVISNDATDHYQTMIIQTDCHSVVFLLQLGEYLDELTPTEMESIRCVKSGRRIVEQNVYKGMPIAGRLDYRWRFKANEGDIIRMLSNDCVEALIKGKVQTFVDPGVLSPELLRKLEDPIPVLINVIESLSGNVASDSSVLSELGALDREQWVNLNPAIGDQVFDMLQSKLLEQSLVPLGETQSVPWGESRKSEAGPLQVPFGAKVITAAFTRNVSKQEAINESEVYGYDLVDGHLVA